MFTLIDAEGEHISEVVEMTDGLIAGQGGAGGGLRNTTIDSSISHEEAWHSS
jgi:hypothetical protein